MRVFGVGNRTKRKKAPNPLGEGGKKKKKEIGQTSGKLHTPSPWQGAVDTLHEKRRKKNNRDPSEFRPLPR